MEERSRSVTALREQWRLQDRPFLDAPTMRSICARDVRNWRARADGFTPASNAARMMLVWPGVIFDARPFALGLCRGVGFTGGAFADWAVFVSSSPIRRPRRRVSTSTACSRVSSWASSSCRREPDKSEGKASRGDVLPPEDVARACRRGMAAVGSGSSGWGVGGSFWTRDMNQECRMPTGPARFVRTSVVQTPAGH